VLQKPGAARRYRADAGHQFGQRRSLANHSRRAGLQETHTLGFRQRNTPHDGRYRRAGRPQGAQPIHHGVYPKRFVHKHDRGLQLPRRVHAIFERVLGRDNAPAFLGFQEAPQSLHGDGFLIANQDSIHSDLIGLTLCKL